MASLTTRQRAIAEKASEDLYRYEKICEEHAAVLRKDPEGYSKAYEEYTAKSNKIGFMPPHADLDHYIEESENVLVKNCTSLLEYVAYCLASS